MKQSLLILLFLGSTCFAQEVRRAEPVYTMTQAEYDATLKHRNDLAEKRNAELQTALIESQKAAAIIPDLDKQIKAQDSQIAGLKWDVIKSRWQFAFVGIISGLAIAIATAYLAKMGLLGVSAAASVARFAAKI